MLRKHETYGSDVHAYVHNCSQKTIVEDARSAFGAQSGNDPERLVSAFKTVPLSVELRMKFNVNVTRRYSRMILERRLRRNCCYWKIEPPSKRIKSVLLYTSGERVR